MPRNSQGAYTLPAGNPVTTGTLIQSTWANTTLSDVANEVTNSLDRNGRGSMLAALKGFDGSIGAPGITFGSEPTTGFSRPASSNMVVSVAGLEVGRWTSTGYAGAAAMTSLTVSGTAALNGGTTIGDAAGDSFAVNSDTVSIPNGLTFTGNIAVSGTTALNGGTTIGDAAGDAFTINSNTANIPNGLNITGGAVNVSSSISFNGGTTIGDAAGDAFTINSSAVSIPNGLNFANGTVGIATSTPSTDSKLDVNGRIMLSSGESTTIPTTDKPNIFRITGGALGISANNEGVSSQAIRFFTTGTERFQITSDGRIFGTAIHNNSGGAAGTTNQFIASGTYTPTPTNVSNTSSLTAFPCQWMRVGNVATVSGVVDGNTTGGPGSVSEFDITLPIASDITQHYNVIGTANGTTGIVSDGTVRGVGGNDQARVRLNATTNAAFTAAFVFTYVIQ